jgi:hypothetical protein
MSVLAVLNALFLIPDLLVQPNNVPGLSSSSTSNGFASAFNQLATDLKSDNLSAAQKAYATVQPDLQSFAPPAHCHHHHSAGLRTSSTSPNFLGQLFSPLVRDLQSGDLSKAQSAYASIQQEFAQLSSALAASSSSASSNALNVKV